MVTNGANRRKLACTPSFCALAFHNGREDRNKDARGNTIDDSSTSDKNLCALWFSNLCVLQARSHRTGYTLGFATHPVMLYDV